jgi:membrane associated rhomboid family serine protease
MGSYARSSGFRMNWRGMITPAIKAIVLICTIVFVGQSLVALFLPSKYTGYLNHYLGLTPYLVTHWGCVWQALTYIFLHGGILHILLNMLFLWMFGVDLERTWGTRRFWSYFLVTGIGAGVVNIIVKTIIDPHPHALSESTIPTIGASGAIYGILLAAAVMFPDRQVWLFPFPVQIPMKIYAIGAGAIEFFATLGTGGDNVSHVTHLGGMLVGYLYLRRGSFFYRARNGYFDWKRKRARKKFEVYMRDHNDEPPSRPDRWVN